MRFRGKNLNDQLRGTCDEHPYRRFEYRYDRERVNILRFRNHHANTRDLIDGTKFLHDVNFSFFLSSVSARDPLGLIDPPRRLYMTSRVLIVVFFFGGGGG